MDDRLKEKVKNKFLDNYFILRGLGYNHKNAIEQAKKLRGDLND